MSETHKCIFILKHIFIWAYLCTCVQAYKTQSGPGKERKSSLMEDTTRVNMAVVHSQTSETVFNCQRIQILWDLGEIEPLPGTQDTVSGPTAITF